MPLARVSRNARCATVHPGVPAVPRCAMLCHIVPRVSASVLADVRTAWHAAVQADVLAHLLSAVLLPLLRLVLLLLSLLGLH